MGTVWLNEQLDILREDVEGRSRVRYQKNEWSQGGGLIFMFSEILGLRNMEKVIRERS